MEQKIPAPGQSWYQKYTDWFIDIVKIENDVVYFDDSNDPNQLIGVPLQRFLFQFRPGENFDAGRENQEYARENGKTFPTDGEDGWVRTPKKWKTLPPPAEQPAPTAPPTTPITGGFKMEKKAFPRGDDPINDDWNDQDFTGGDLRSIWESNPDKGIFAQFSDAYAEAKLVVSRMGQSIGFKDQLAQKKRLEELKKTKGIDALSELILGLITRGIGRREEAKASTQLGYNVDSEALEEEKSEGSLSGGFNPSKPGGLQMKQVRTSRTKVAHAPNTLKRKAFLDALYDEAVEDPYQYSTIKEAVDALTSRHSLSLDEILYLKKKADGGKIMFVEQNRNK